MSEKPKVCPSCTWRGEVELTNGVCPQCSVNWESLHYQSELVTLTQRLEAAEAERDALLEALKPFAKEGAGIHINQPDNMQMYLDNYDPTEDGSYGKTDLTIGDFRKAAALVGDV